MTPADSGQGDRANSASCEVLTLGDTTRKPLLLFRLSGVFLLRLAVLAFLGLLFQEPPRSTRFPRLPMRRHDTQKPVGGALLPLVRPTKISGASSRFESQDVSDRSLDLREIVVRQMSHRPDDVPLVDCREDATERRRFDQSCGLPVGQQHISAPKRRRDIARNRNDDQLGASTIELVDADDDGQTPLTAGIAAEGNSVRITSPGLKLVIRGVLVVVPDFLKRLIRGHPPLANVFGFRFTWGVTQIQQRRSQNPPFPPHLHGRCPSRFDEPHGHCPRNAQQLGNFIESVEDVRFNGDCGHATTRCDEFGVP